MYTFEPNQRKNLRKPRRRRRGLTLIEILVVVTILGMIAGIVGIAVANQLAEAKINTAGIQIKNYADALELYKIKIGRYPNTTEGLESLAKPPKGKPFVEQVGEDPWGNKYIYQSPGTHNPQKFDLSSKGDDGVEGTEDDIGNWSK